MSAILRVAELNNRGATLLIARRDKEAMKALQTALTTIESRMQSIATGEDNTTTATATSELSSSTATTSSSFLTATTPVSSTVDHHSSNSNLASVNGTAYPATDIDMDEQDGDTPSAASLDHSDRFLLDFKSSSAIPELKDDRYFIFNRPMLITVPPSSSLPAQDSECPASLVCFYTCVLIYNLALAFHIRAVVPQIPPVPAPLPAPPPPPQRASTTPSVSTTTNRHGSIGTVNGTILARSAPTSPGVSPTSSFGSSRSSESRGMDSSRLALSQSLRLYEHCLRLARSVKHCSEDCKVLLYATSCNLAHVYCRKGDRSRAQELLAGLEEEAYPVSFNSTM